MQRHRIVPLVAALLLTFVAPAGAAPATEGTAETSVATEVAAENVVAEMQKAAAHAFTPGEELVYKITALGMTAGKARISVGLGSERDGVKAWPVVVQARTDSLFDSVYTVRDKFVTWWHPESGRVIGADLFADEGGKRHRSTSKLDHASGKAEVMRIREWSGERSKKTYQIPAGSYDIAGAIFELRRRPLTPGSVEEVDVFTGKKVFKLRCVVEKQEQVKTKAGTFDAVAVRIQLGFDGQFASKRDVLAWFSNDERHVPIKFEAEFALGSIVAELVEAKRGIRL
ncbi:DUF3108 domain-containing protein [Vulgatibacter sp.]|uniref:DUF3108 domain-containing protein n=1 Tax=Vulgatibacter sp. TaxID=1971226 RepID=UPI003565DFE2